eukprot:1081678-Rhodomonas_salina.1
MAAVCITCRSGGGQQSEEGRKKKGGDEDGGKNKGGASSGGRPRYRATRALAKSGTVLRERYAMYAIVLRECYAVSSTDPGYDSNAADVLRDVRS